MAGYGWPVGVGMFCGMWRLLTFLLVLPVLWVALTASPCPQTIQAAGAVITAQPCGGYGPPCTASAAPSRPSRTPGIPGAGTPARDCAPGSPGCELPRTGRDTATAVVSLAAFGAGLLLVGFGLMSLTRRRRRH
jgi:LPXTG-motif cell wall-anchored protein